MLYPDFCFTRVIDISEDFFDNLKIKTVLLDIDGTLVPHNHPTPSFQLVRWVNKMKEKGIDIILFSNNKKRRVKKFANKLDLPFYYNVEKPRQKFFQKIKETKGENVCMIGDQIFTDVLGGNIANFITILVNPVEEAQTPLFVKFKRILEKPFRKAKRKRGD